jgi:zinc-ribbon domain
MRNKSFLIFSFEQLLCTYSLTYGLEQVANLFPAGYEIAARGMGMAQFCTACGTGLRDNAQFCTSCGTKAGMGAGTGVALKAQSEALPSRRAPTVSAAISAEPIESSPFSAEEAANTSIGSNRILALTVAALLGCGIFGWLLFGQQSSPAIPVDVISQTDDVTAPLDSVSVPPADDVEDIPPAPVAEPANPIVQGRYTAFIADQDIRFEWEKGAATGLHQTGGTASYANAITGGVCLARLVADQGGGGDMVQFSQVPIVGRTPCERSIPVQLTARGPNGLANVLHAEWLDPSSGQVVMSGDLTRSDRP